MLADVHLRLPRIPFEFRHRIIDRWAGRFYLLGLGDGGIQRSGIVLEVEAVANYAARGCLYALLPSFLYGPEVGSRRGY
jgi:DNA-binding transcriptional LysR family regulator